MARILVYDSVSAAGGAGGELLAAGLAMRDAIVDDLRALAGVSVTCAVPRSAGCRQSGSFASVAPRPGEDAPAFVGRLAAVHDLAWVVAPETGGELGRLHAAVGDARWIGCSAAAIRRAGSKSATLHALAAAGVPTPLDDVANPGTRWLVKPDDGAGCLSTRVHRDHDSACAHRQPGDTLEPFVEGEPLSISMIVGAELATAVSYNRQRIAIDGDGRLSDLGVQPAALDAASDPRIPALAAVAAATARALPGLRGFVGIDGVWNEQRGAGVIEVNPRLTCAYVGLSARLGRNLAAEVLRLSAAGAACQEHGDDVHA